MKRTRLSSLLAFLTVMVAPTSLQAHAANSPSMLASFEGSTINLAKGWGSATACIQDSTGAHCYRTEAELDRRNPSAVTAAPGASLAALSCSSSVRLYRGTTFTGSVLVLTLRQTIIDLASAGFDNDTSSYKIGSCSATFTSAAGLAGSIYPGHTTANASATAMNAGWDNVVSSVYID